MKVIVRFKEEEITNFEAKYGLEVENHNGQRYIIEFDNMGNLVVNKICNFITYWFTVTYNVYQRAVLNLVSFWYHYITFVIISLNFISYIFLLYF